MLLERNNKSYILKVLYRAEAKRTNFTRFAHVCTLFVHGLITNCVEHVGMNNTGAKGRRERVNTNVQRYHNLVINSKLLISCCAYYFKVTYVQ